MITVLLADDQALIRAGFRVLLDSADTIEVIAEAADGRQAVQLARARIPDVVLMDIRMPGMDGLEATRQIAADPACSDVKVLILTTFETHDYIFAALAAGASGFLVKDTEPADLIQAIHIIARGDALLSPSVTRTLIADVLSHPRRPPVHPAALAPLTDRERQIVALVGTGLSNEQIAAQLVLSPLTAKTHVSRAMTKLGCRDRAQLVITAYETGLVTPGG